MNDEIQSMLNKPYGADLQGQNDRYVCWCFCCEVYSLLGLELQNFFHERELKRLDTPVVPCIVLFRAIMKWHAGVVWPDSLHFIHASTKNIFDPTLQEYIACKDRLTAWPYKMIIEGYYAV